MAQLRLMVLVVCAACGRSEAAPGSGLAAPAGWRSAPEIAKAAGDAAGSGVTASEAWAEPARGCYAVWLALHGAAGPIDVASDQLVASVQKTGASTSAIAKPAVAERGELVLAFEKSPYRGRLRAQLAKTGDVGVLACMWNEREPKACEAGCSTLLGSLR
jgi:hypothetical protein